MTDCPNVEVRELLPELLHEGLDAAARQRVERHVATCGDCAAELALLHDARTALRASYRPRVDTAAIVAALPRPGGRASLLRGAGSARPRVAWRIAAAVAAIALGGLSFTVARSPFGASSGAPAVASGGDSGEAAAVSAVFGETALAVATPAPRPVGLTAGDGLGDLGDRQLETLLGELDRLEAAPAVEPDALTGTRLVAGTTTGSED